MKAGTAAVAAQKAIFIVFFIYLRESYVILALFLSLMFDEAVMTPSALQLFASPGDVCFGVNQPL